MSLYTVKAENALKYAEKTAKKLHHSYTGTEHILLGLIRGKESMAGKILSDYGVSEDKILELIDQLIAPEGVRNVADPEGYTPRARKVLGASEKEAKACGARQIGTEHILIAILKEQDSVAARLLNTVGIDVQKMYIDILTAMGQEIRVTREDLKSGRLLRDAQSGAATTTLNQYSRDITALGPGRKAGSGNRSQR